jgi:hypothetical protein
LKTTKPENEQKKIVEDCGWSATQQQHSICRISAKHYENEEQVTENWRNCGWSVTQQQHRNAKQSERRYYLRQNLSNFRNKHENEEQFAAK